MVVIADLCSFSRVSTDYINNLCNKVDERNDDQMSRLISAVTTAFLLLFEGEKPLIGVNKNYLTADEQATLGSLYSAYIATMSSALDYFDGFTIFPSRLGAFVESLTKLSEIVERFTDVFWLRCPITQDYITCVASLTYNGNLYSEKVLQEWFARSCTDPVTGTVLENTVYHTGPTGAILRMKAKIRALIKDNSLDVEREPAERHSMYVKCVGALQKWMGESDIPEDIMTSVKNLPKASAKSVMFRCEILSRKIACVAYSHNIDPLREFAPGEVTDVCTVGGLMMLMTQDIPIYCGLVNPAARFYEGAELDGVVITGKVYRGESFRNISFVGAKFDNVAFDRCDFTGAATNFYGARFSNCAFGTCIVNVGSTARVIDSRNILFLREMKLRGAIFHECVFQ